jgi:hypothetical protein
LRNLLHDVPENHEADPGNQKDYPQNHNDHAFRHGISLGFLKYAWLVRKAIITALAGNAA